MDRFLGAAASFLGLKRRKKKGNDKEQRGTALNLNSSGVNELTVHATQTEKEGKLKDKGKLFVGGLHYATTSQELSAYFSKFGDVINGVVIKFPKSGKSRGFGFVSFLHLADAEKALQTKHHVLHGRTIECRPFDSRVDSKEITSKRTEKARVFLGGLPADVTKKELEQFFSRYGKVINVIIPVDGKSKNAKGFAFISFENEDVAEKCISERFVYLKGRRVFMNKAHPRDVGPRDEDGISGPYGSTLTDPDLCTDYREDIASLQDEDTQSSSSGQLNFGLEQHPEFQRLFQNYFAKKLNHYSEMSGREFTNRKQQLQNNEIKTLENFFRKMAVISPLDFDQDTESESANSDTSDESYEEDCENLVSFLVPQIDSDRASKNSTGKNPSKVTPPFEKNGKERPDLRFYTQEFTEDRLHAPMNFKNNTGSLTCSVCQWIPPDSSFETFLSHCKTPAHKIKLAERFPESQRQNNAQNFHECEKMQQTHQYFKPPEQSLPQQVIKQEVQKVETVKKKKKKQKKKKNKQNQEQTVLNSVQESQTGGDPNSENKKQVSQKSKEETKDNTNTLNLKMYALAKGMASVQALSEKELICKTCEKQIPSSSNFDALMKNVMLHLESKKHLQKLVKTEDKLMSLLSKTPEPGETGSSGNKNSTAETAEGNKVLAKKIKSPKDQTSLSSSKASLVQEKTVLEPKKPNPKDLDIKSQNAKGKTDNFGVKFLCLQCNFSNSTFEEFGRHLESVEHSSTSPLNGALRAKNPECTECSSCNAFLFGSLYEMNVHFSKCLKNKQ